MKVNRQTYKLIKPLLIAIIIIANVGCDQVSKNMVRKDLAYDHSVGFISNHFTLLRVENTGAFLSLGDSISPVMRMLLLIVLPLAMLLGALVVLLRKKGMEVMPLVAACFIIGGGIGNIYDRLTRGSVTDFMHIDFGLFQTGIFNMADVSVTIGIFALLGYFYFVKPKDDKALGSV